MTYKIELWSEGERIAAVEGYRASAVLDMAAQYARQYERDGTLVLKLKNPKRGGNEQ